jgi:hypothetical protein
LWQGANPQANLFLSLNPQQGWPAMKIYFSLALSRELDELSVCLIDAAISYKFYCEDSPKKESWENIESLLSEATIDASSALRIAEAEFRELLGVEPNTDENSKPR